MKSNLTTPDEVFLEDIDAEEDLKLSDDDGEIIDVILGEHTIKKSIFDEEDDITMKGDE